jgi:predicted RND superfamily exporter protein
MNPVFFLETTTGSAGETAANAALQFVNNPILIAAAIGFIIVTIIVILLLKNIIINSILGVIAWAIITYAFGISLPFWPSLAVSAIFGLAGIGVMLILRFFGVM